MHQFPSCEPGLIGLGVVPVFTSFLWSRCASKRKAAARHRRRDLLPPAAIARTTIQPA
jgi:hypothetical protein